MTVLVDDPLIAGMDIARTLPLHESSRRLRGLYPECPRVYGVAVMSDLTRRRWWPLPRGTDRRSAARDVRDRRAGHGQPGGRRPAARGHPGPRRHRPGDSTRRAGGAGLGHGTGEPVGARRLRGRDRLGGRRRIRRCGRCPTIRSSATEPGGAAHFARDGMVRLPSEAALTTWVAHRSHRALAPLFAKLFDISGGAIPWRRCGTSSGPPWLAPRRTFRCWPGPAS